MKKIKINKRGFTLIELLVVITIVAIVSVVSYLALAGQSSKARNSVRLNDLGTIASAFSVYRVDGNSYVKVETASGEELTNAYILPTYLPKIPKDPKTKNAYKYATDGYNATYQAYGVLEAMDATQTLGSYGVVVGTGKFVAVGDYAPVLIPSTIGNPVPSGSNISIKNTNILTELDIGSTFTFGGTQFTVDAVDSNAGTLSLDADITIASGDVFTLDSSVSNTGAGLMTTIDGEVVVDGLAIGGGGGGLTTYTLTVEDNQHESGIIPAGNFIVFGILPGDFSYLESNIIVGDTIKYEGTDYTITGISGDYINRGVNKCVSINPSEPVDFGSPMWNGSHESDLGTAVDCVFAVTLDQPFNEVVSSTLTIEK